jgi:hypothetical protein
MQGAVSAAASARRQQSRLAVRMEVQHSQTMTAELSERLHTDAEARITWGDPPEDVIALLVSQGMSPDEAAPLVAALVQERDKEVRWRSLRKLLIGGGTVLAAVIFFTVLPWRAWRDSLNESGLRLSRHTDDLGTVLAFMVAGQGLVGAWYALRGITGLIVPRGEELSDVEPDESLDLRPWYCRWFKR